MEQLRTSVTYFCSDNRSVGWILYKLQGSTEAPIDNTRCHVTKLLGYEGAGMITQCPLPKRKMGGQISRSCQSIEGTSTSLQPQPPIQSAQARRSIGTRIPPLHTTQDMSHSGHKNSINSKAPVNKESRTGCDYARPTNGFLAASGLDLGPSHLLSLARHVIVALRGNDWRVGGPDKGWLVQPDSFERSNPTLA